MSPKKAKKKLMNFLYIPLGPFQWRIPRNPLQSRICGIFQGSDPWRYSFKFHSVPD